MIKHFLFKYKGPADGKYNCFRIFEIVIEAKDIYEANVKSSDLLKSIRGSASFSLKELDPSQLELVRKRIKDVRKMRYNTKSY